MITNMDDLQLAIARSTLYNISKGISSSTLSSGWRSGNHPAAGAIPTAVEVCFNTTPGAVPIVNAPVNKVNYLVEAQCGTTSTNQIAMLLSDRLIHMGGLSGTVTTTQTVGIDASVIDINDRRGSPDYSDLEWWIECYSSLGNVTASAELAVTYTDDTMGSISTPLPSSVATGRLVQIVPDTGKYIKAIHSLTLSAAAASVGNFGVTLSRTITQVTPRVNETITLDWGKTAIQRIPQNACLWTFIYSPSSTITIYAFLRIASM